METKEIKLTQKQKIDNAIAALAEAINQAFPTDQPKKERWFRQIGKNRKLQKFSDTNWNAGIIDHNIWEEVTPDFVCQHSGEGFMYGDEYRFVNIENGELDYNSSTKTKIGYETVFKV